MKKRLFAILAKLSASEEGNSFLEGNHVLYGMKGVWTFEDQHYRVFYSARIKSLANCQKDGFTHFPVGTLQNSQIPFGLEVIFHTNSFRTRQHFVVYNQFRNFAFKIRRVASSVS